MSPPTTFHSSLSFKMLVEWNLITTHTNTYIYTSIALKSQCTAAVVSGVPRTTPGSVIHQEESEDAACGDTGSCDVQRMPHSTVSTERCTDEVQRTVGAGFQEFHPSGVTQDVPETPNSELLRGTREMLPSRESRQRLRAQWWSCRQPPPGTYHIPDSELESRCSAQTMLFAQFMHSSMVRTSRNLSSQMPAKGQLYKQAFQRIAVRYAMFTLFCTATFLKSLFPQVEVPGERWERSGCQKWSGSIC